MKPRFSVITPVFNGVSFISGYIETLRNQAFQDWEAIVVDDGSTDGTFPRLLDAASSDSRFRVLRSTLPKQVAGPYQARNIGLDFSSGEFICFLDIDDRWLPNKLYVQHQELLRNGGLQLLYSPYFRVPYGNSSRVTVRSSPPFLAPKCLILIANPVPLLTACVRRSLLQGISFRAISHEDYIFWHEVFARVQSSEILYTRTPLAVYSVNRGSLSGNKMRASVWIWKCYAFLGYSLPQSVAAFVARGLLQVFMMLAERFSRVRVSPTDCIRVLLD